MARTARKILPPKVGDDEIYGDEKLNGDSETLY